MSRILDIGTQFLDANGNPLSGGKLNFYDTGTTNRKTTYSDSDLSVANANPVVMGADGVPGNIFGTGDYKMVLTDSAGVQLRSMDPVQSCCGATDASTTTAGIVKLATIAQTNTGTAVDRAVTPDGLDGWIGSTQVTKVGTIGTGTWQGGVIAAAYLAATGAALTAVKTTTYTAAANDLIPINTSGGAWTLTLPASPTVGNRVYFFDYGQTFNSNNLTIARNGKEIMNLAQDLVCDVQYYSGSLLYVNATQGWILV